MKGPALTIYSEKQTRKAGSQSSVQEQYKPRRTVSSERDSQESSSTNLNVVIDQTRWPGSDDSLATEGPLLLKSTSAEIYSRKDD
ncbi:hypothetical protein TNIN_77771 [Trichonephila inaurata madagascariensis]|uniref:Uncharacterized protein n=1 Tax=Trichonephila inaurata madagascariensis TaxID=2747483 RepID=A0A8X6YPQ2_9ARAC|nr:hypothetical protein TNIN_77771 [Trichonephila inaurata madagascariensis]